MLPQTLIDRLRYVEIFSTRAVRAHRTGDYLSPLRGRGFDFDQHKPYQQGDDYRQIDWNVTARMRVPFVKREFEEKELSAMVMVDLSRSMLFTSSEQSKRELLLEVAAVLAFSAAADNMNVGLLAFTDRVECYERPRKGAHQAWRLLETLWKLAPQGRRTDFVPALERVMASMKRTGLIFCLSDFISAGPLWDMPFLRTATHKHDFVPVMLEDPWEEEIPHAGGYLRLKDAEEDRELIVTLSGRRCRQYQRLLSERREAVRRHFYRLNLDHLALRTDEDYLNRVMAFFVARKRRR
jgi:uncharacterized protein (DUF58 family)